MQNTFTTLNNLFLSSSLYLDQDGNILKNKIIEDAQNLNPELIKILLKDKNLKKTFFTEVDEILVFDKVKFSRFLDNKEFLPDSFTAYKNKIGLTVNGNFISSTHDVVLDFPYKDCVLEGGQTKDDQKRAEIFYNETLAPDQVTNLLSPKCFCNAKKYDEKGAHDINKIEDTDNLIIKGNNLIVLSCLLERYRGKVKCIYIDPPYNTGNDSFGYNDSFNHSTWLVFMKNRLELARKLLRDDGAIYVQLDYHQVHYAKILLDEIFGEENFQREIIWRIGWLSGYKTTENNYIRNHDTILFYSKNKKNLDFHKDYLYNQEFKKAIPEKDLSKIIKKLVSLGCSKNDAETFVEEINQMPEKYPIEDVWNASEYDDLNSIAIVSFSGETVSKLLNKEDEVKGQKSEALIKRIIKSHTEEGDIVLDFFGGTGTTAAVAMKMKRKFIICEQLDKHIDISVRRLEKVIAGEQSGISKSQNWTGGGSFVYCELAKQNATFIDKINSCKTDKEITKTIQEILNSDFVSSKVIPSEIDTNAKDFTELSCDGKKKFAIALLDKNLLYINKTDINDTDNLLSQNDKEFTKNFYGESK